MTHNTPTVLLIGPVSNTHIERWATALREHDWRVSLVSTEALPDPLPAWLRGVPCVELPVANAGMSAAQRLVTLLRGWARLPGLVAALKPDLVHLHSLPAPAATPFLRRVPRLIVSAWGSDVVQRDARKARWYPALLRHATHVTATSHYLAGIVQTYVPRYVDIVPFGVDVARFVPARHPPSGLTLGTLRHLEANYGIDTLLDAMPIIQSVIQESAELHIGGAGSLEAALRAQARELGIAGNVHWWGRVPHADVPRFLQQFRVFAMPSRAESFGVAALEAQACGVPVVATNVGGLPEVVRDNETGLLVPPNDPVALAHAVTTLLGDHQQHAIMSTAARQWVTERYRWEESVRLMLDVYSEC